MTEQHGSSLAIRDEQDFFTDKQLAALRQLGVQDAGNADLAVFFHYSQRTGLDPFARQIYMVGRWSREGTKYTIQTGIDGFRLVGRRAADRHGETLEVTDTEWCGPDGVWCDVWLADEPPAAARVAVIRNGGRFPAVALFREYAQTKKDGTYTQMWAEKGALMIAKCAEALAWRKAFPQDLSGLYTSDEMAMANRTEGRPQSEPQGPRLTQVAAEADAEVVDETTGEVFEAEVVESEHESEAEPIRSSTRARMFALLGEAGVTDADEQRSRMSKLLGREVESRSSLTEAEAQRVIHSVEALLKAAS